MIRKMVSEICTHNVGLHHFVPVSVLEYDTQKHLALLPFWTDDFGFMTWWKLRLAVSYFCGCPRTWMLAEIPNYLPRSPANNCDALTIHQTTQMTYAITRNQTWLIRQASIGTETNGQRHVAMNTHMHYGMSHCDRSNLQPNQYEGTGYTKIMVQASHWHHPLCIKVHTPEIKHNEIQTKRQNIWKQWCSLIENTAGEMV